ncbi:MAG: hypothetical protein ACRBCJ_11260 [Hyphomicrobiaceae bacterium]
MSPLRMIAVFLMILGLALGSTVGIAAATEQAFANPCPMEHQDGDMPCCPDDCMDAMLSCSAKCASAVVVGTLPVAAAWAWAASNPAFETVRNTYNEFATDPPSPIPIV